MPPAPTTYPPIGPDELILVLVYGAGTETDTFHLVLRESLRRYGYELRTVHLSNYLSSIFGRGEFKRERPQATRELQDMGDELREKTGNKAVLADLAVYLIASLRSREPEGQPRIAWLIRSLKRPEEVLALRQLYGPRFILLGLHVPEPVRRKNAQKRWQRWANVTSQRFEEEATVDIRRDELDRQSDYGQAVRNTMATADFFIDGRSKESVEATLPRAVHLIFGEPFEPPRREEQAMYHAFTAGLRSAEMGRQVGAAIISCDGDLLVVGTNEVPAAGGGLYWSPDQPDGRDFAQDPPFDSNTLWQRRISRELLVRMRQKGWLNTKRATTLEDGQFDISEERLNEFLSDVNSTRFSGLTEFGRAVHAEMDAITTAARRGISVDGGTLVCTTYPCHNCARHVIAAGICRVIYIHPYAKSLAHDLHDEAVVFEPEDEKSAAGKVRFEQYIGVAPRVYPQYFSFGQDDRKEADGRAMKSPTSHDALPRGLSSGGAFSFGGPAFPATQLVELERSAAQDFRQLISKNRDLELPTPTPEEQAP